MRETICCSLEQVEFGYLFYVILYSNQRDVSEIHFLKVLETKHNGIQTCRRKANLKPMKMAKSILRTLNIYGIYQLLAKRKKSPNTNIKESYNLF